jgi:hypothetical protein
LTNDIVQKKSKEILAIYADENGALKHEQAIFSGKERFQVANEMTNASDLKENEALEEGDSVAVWDNFYGKLNEIQVSVLDFYLYFNFRSSTVSTTKPM